jgi:lipoprotein-anchoring transpeptidase ErfK/SrfK
MVDANIKHCKITKPNYWHRRFRVFDARNNTPRHAQSPKLENPAGNGTPVGSFEEEQPETSVPIFAAKK